MIHGEFVVLRFTATAAAAEAAVAAAVRGSGTAVGNRDKKTAVAAAMIV